MKVTSKTRADDPERRLIINLITNTQFCREVLRMIDPTYLSPYARQVVSWIKPYFEEFEKAPERDVRSLYAQHRETIQDEETDDELGLFLASLSKDYEELVPNNVDFEVKAATSFLKCRSLEVLAEKLVDSVDAKKPEVGEAALATFKRVERPFGEGISLLHDSEKVMDAFTREDETLFTFPGALGEVAGNMNRGDFVSFLAPMKRGKSWYLWYVAETAMHHHHKVLFFTLEMTDRQMIQRAWRSLVGQPKTTRMVEVPYFVKDDDQWVVETREEERQGLDVSAVADIQRRLRRKFRKGDVRMVSLPNKSATVQDLITHLDNLEHHDHFVPDVIVVDYADILMPARFLKEYRHGLDDIWSSLRRLAMERNCLVVTASQTEKTTFKKDVGAESAAEDIRKIAHITCGLALNQTKAEAEMGILRVSQIVVREERQCFDQAVVLQCLDIGRPCIDSRLRKEVNLPVDRKPEYERKQD